MATTTDESFALDLESGVPLRKVKSGITLAPWGIVAEKPIPANQEIFRIKQPLVNVVSDAHIKETCDYCFLWTRSVLRKEAYPAQELSVLSCKGCQTVRYCSRKCQVQAWKRHHKAECKLYDSLRPAGIPHFLRAVIRLLHLRSSKILPENEWQALLNLESHKDKYKTAEGSFWLGVEANCRDIKHLTGTEVEEDVLGTMICVYFINSMSIESPEGTVIGSSLDPRAALMNHSCDPNAALFFEGAEMRVRPTRNIPAGVEITIAYIDPTETFDFRREQLSSKYFFECSCAKCEKGPCGPGEFRTKSPQLNERIREAQCLLRALLQSDPKTTSFEAIEDRADRIRRERDLGQPWPCEMQPNPQLMVALAGGYQDGNVVKAFKFWLKTCFEVGPLLWSDQHSLRRVQHFMKYLSIEGVVANLVSEDDPRVQVLQPFKSTISVLQYPHIMRFVIDSARGFGEDSIIAMVAKVWQERWNTMLASRGMDCKMLASYCASSKGKLQLKADEMKMLEWAKNFQG